MAKSVDQRIKNLPGENYTEKGKMHLKSKKRRMMSSQIKLSHQSLSAQGCQVLARFSRNTTMP